MGTISNDTDLKLDWQPVESKLLAAVAYVAPRRILYLRFHSCEVYRYFTFPADQYQEFLDAESKGPLLPQPHPESLSLPKAPPPLKGFLGQIKTVLAGRGGVERVV